MIGHPLWKHYHHHATSEPQNPNVNLISLSLTSKISLRALDVTLRYLDDRMRREERSRWLSDDGMIADWFVDVHSRCIFRPGTQQRCQGDFGRRYEFSFLKVGIGCVRRCKTSSPMGMSLHPFCKPQLGNRQMKMLLWSTIPPKITLLLYVCVSRYCGD